MNQPSIDRLKPATIYTLFRLPAGMHRIGFQTDDSNPDHPLPLLSNAASPIRRGAKRTTLLQTNDYFITVNEVVSVVLWGKIPLLRRYVCGKGGVRGGLINTKSEILNSKRKTNCYACTLFRLRSG